MPAPARFWAPGGDRGIRFCEALPGALRCDARRLRGTRLVPSGTRLQVGPTALVTTEDAQFPESENMTEVAVRSERNTDQVVAEAGATGTLADSADLSNLVEAELLTEVSGGRRAETDEQLRFRLVRALRTPSSPEGLRAQVLSDEDVAEVDIEESVYGPGTAEAFVTPAVAFPPDDLRERIESDVEGPSRIYVTLPAYEGLALKVRATSIPNGAEGRVVDYVNNLPTGDALIVNEIEDRVREAGAEDAQVVSVKRGTVSGDQSELVDPTTLDQITNLTPQNGRTRFYTQESWVTVCN